MMRISPGFFSTLGTRLIAGREFDERDTLGLETTGFRSVIVNESFARRYFGGRNPVGRRVGIGNQPDTPHEHRDHRRDQGLQPTLSPRRRRSRSTSSSRSRRPECLPATARSM